MIASIRAPVKANATVCRTRPAVVRPSRIVTRAQDAENILSKAGAAIDDAAQRVKEGVTGASDDVQKNANKAQRRAGDAVDDVQDKGRNIGQDIKDRATELKDGAQRAAEDLADGIKDVGRKVQDGAKDASDSIKRNV